MSYRQRRNRGFWLPIVITGVAILAAISSSTVNRYAGLALFTARSVHLSVPVVVFECDDWHLSGSQDKAALESLRVRGYSPTIWANYGQETVDDLSRLYDVLARHHDAGNRPACLTANVVMANPDFDRIRAGGFRAYYRKPIDEDWPKDVVEAYRQGITRRVFYPQLHGLDHIAADAWLAELRSGAYECRMLFDLGYSSDPNTILGLGTQWRGEFVDISNVPSKVVPLEYQQRQLVDASGLFHRLFGFRPTSFIAPAYYFDDTTVQACRAAGIRYIQAATQQIEAIDRRGEMVRKRRYLGEPLADGALIAMARTCAFEPRGMPIRARQACLGQVRRALRLNLPAVIDVHSLNFVGRVDPNMAAVGREELDGLLFAIEREYPDVRYLTSPELGELISTGQYSDVFSGQQVELPGSRMSFMAWTWSVGLIPGAVLLLTVVGLGTVRQRYIVAKKARPIRAKALQTLAEVAA